MLVDVETKAYLRMRGKGQMPAELEREIHEFTTPTAVAAGVAYIVVRQSSTGHILDGVGSMLSGLRR